MRRIPQKPQRDVFQNKRAPVKFARAQDLGKGTILGIVNEYVYSESMYRLESSGVDLERGINEQANLNMLARGHRNAAVA